MRRFATLLAVLALAATACGTTKDDGFPPTPTPTETEDGGADTSTLESPAAYDGPIHVEDNVFVARFVEVAAGATVEWDQTGSAPHNIVADDGGFNSHPDCAGSDVAACMGSGDTYELEFDTAGQFNYYCIIHGFPGDPGNPANMAGAIIVT